jgi:hypothetical protein
VTSPYSGSTYGNYDDVDTCGDGPDQGFSYVLDPGKRIRIWQVSNTFNSAHTLRHSGAYPGEFQESCICTGEEFVESTFANIGITAVPVHFVVDAGTQNSAGDFELAWVIETPGT